MDNSSFQSAELIAASPREYPLWFRLVFGRSPRRTAVRIVCVVGLSYLLFHFVLAPIRVYGISMEPNFHDRSIHLINRAAYLFHEPQRGDVVACKYTGPHLLLLKRIVGLPGERIRIRRGVIYVNGEPLEEPYLKIHPKPWNEPSVRLGPSEYFLVGDNRNMDEEDHTHGARNRIGIIGKIIF